MTFWVIVLLLYIWYKAAELEGTYISNKLCRAKKVKAGAEIDNWKTIKSGTMSAATFELIVRFTDGTTYRTAIGKNRKIKHNKWKYYYTEEDLNRALIEAVTEHERVAMKKG